MRRNGRDAFPSSPLPSLTGSSSADGGGGRPAPLRRRVSLSVAFVALLFGALSAMSPARAQNQAQDPTHEPLVFDVVQISGFVDRIVHRHELRNEIGRIIDYAGK